MVSPAAPGPEAKPATTPPLRLLFWESTVGCNLACVHCRRLEVAKELSKFDLTTAQATAVIRSLPEVGRPILVFSGGEPLMRPDIFELIGAAREAGLPCAMATNGTMVDEAVARRIIDSGVRRVSISFDGPDAETHDKFRGLHGAFADSIRGFKALRAGGMSMQVNTTVARHNYHKLDTMYRLALDLGADALHIFMLVPVGCGMELSEEIMLKQDEYEHTLNWIYDRNLEGKMHMKATCAPHYFRVTRQRAKAEGRRAPAAPQAGRPGGPSGGHPGAPAAGGHPAGHPGGHPAGHPGGTSGGGGDEMTAVTKGCLAGQAVCFLSHTGEVFPCGYLPVSSGNVKTTPLPAIWRESHVFAELRDEENLGGKCGVCEYKKVCMGCRARAFAQTHDYLAEEPNCGYVPLRVRAGGAAR